MFFSQLKDVITGGKIENKIGLKWQTNLNFLVYRSGKVLLAFKLSFYLTFTRCFVSAVNTKSVYLNKNLTKSIKSRLNPKQWIKIDQKKLLIKHVENCQIYLSVLSIKKNFLSKIFYAMELLLNSLLFQVYTVELLASNQSSRLSGVDNKILKNTSKSKFKFLLELKIFKKTLPLPLKQIYISKKINKKQRISILSINDRLVQQLFALVLESYIESNSDSYTYGFWKNRNPIMTIRDIQKNLQNQIWESHRNLKSVYVWDAELNEFFGSTSYSWLLKNSPFPPKYRYILKNWLKLGHIEFGLSKIGLNDKGIPQGGILNLLLMNFSSMPQKLLMFF